jgi:hypothetical protein
VTQAKDDINELKYLVKKLQDAAPAPGGGTAF